MLSDLKMSGRKAEIEDEKESKYIEENRGDIDEERKDFRRR